jgi:predicted nucleic acid-binding protein
LKPVVVDTSVWRRFFAGVPAFRKLAELLDEDASVLIHPFVVGELVMGGLSSKEQALFERLPVAMSIPHEEVLEFVRRRRLMRRGVGWIDAHLLASALGSSGLLWTADGDLAALARELKVEFAPAAP